MVSSRVGKAVSVFRGYGDSGGLPNGGGGAKRHIAFPGAADPKTKPPLAFYSFWLCKTARLLPVALLAIYLLLKPPLSPQ